MKGPSCKYKPNLNPHLKRVSLNCYAISQINNVEDIVNLANLAQPIYHKNWGVKPASVILGMQFRSVVESVKRGYFYQVINTSKLKVNGY